MPSYSFVNGIITTDTLSTHPEACLQAAPIGVSDGENSLGVVLDPHTYEGLLRLAIAYRQQQSEEESPQNMSDALTTFTDMGERLLGATSNEVVGDDGQTRPHHNPNPDDDQSPS